MTAVKPFDAADYLDSDEMIVEYLCAALEDENPDVFLAAVSDVARARGMTAISNRTGLGRESLYKALSRDGNPSFRTVLGVATALGYRFTVRAVS